MVDNDEKRLSLDGTGTPSIFRSSMDNKGNGPEVEVREQVFTVVTERLYRKRVFTPDK
jgi:hypothetical protein